MKKRLPRLEIIVPISNHVKVLLPLLKEYDAIAATLRGHATVSYLCVNDGSADGSTQLLHRIFREREDLRVIDLAHGFGYAAAVACGLEYFDGDIAFILDDDLQSGVDTMVPLFRAWQQGAKTAVIENRPPVDKGLGARLGKWLQRHSPAVPPLHAGNCLLDRSMVARLKVFKERHRTLSGLVGLSAGDIWRVKPEGKAVAPASIEGGGFIDSLQRIIDLSSLPMHAFAKMGAAVTIGSALGIIGSAMAMLMGHRPSGWLLLLLGMGLGMGLQLFCLGVLGEYLTRILQEVKKRPLYLIDRVLERKPEKTAAAS